jgi:hypothetical protein
VAIRKRPLRLLLLLLRQRQPLMLLLRLLHRLLRPLMPLLRPLRLHRPSNPEFGFALGKLGRP